jgi:PhnB protein
MASLTPYLIVRDAARAIEFYQRVLGAREVFRLTSPGDGRIGHAHLEIGDSALMLADEWPDFGALGPSSIGGTPVRLHLNVPDVDAVVAAAEAAGATVLRAVKDEFYGERTGMIADPFGHQWHIGTPIEDVPADELQRRWDTAMTG